MKTSGDMEIESRHITAFVLWFHRTWPMCILQHRATVQHIRFNH